MVRQLRRHSRPSPCAVAALLLSLLTSDTLSFQRCNCHLWRQSANYVTSSLKRNTWNVVERPPRQRRKSNRRFSSLSNEEQERTKADERNGIEKNRNYLSVLPDFMQKDPTAQKFPSQWTSTTTTSRASNANTNSSSNSGQNNNNNMQMMAMSAISLALAFSVIFSLASSNNSISNIPSDYSYIYNENTLATDILEDINSNQLEVATRNVAKMVLPQSADDVIAVSIGEGIAGAMGAVATVLLGIVLPFSEADQKQQSSLSRRQSVASMRGREQLVSEAVADGDYFLTRAAAQPLFQAMGMPDFIVMLESIVVANLPYQAIKLSSKRRREKEQQQLLELLLEEEERRERSRNVVDRWSNNISNLLQRLNPVTISMSGDSGDVLDIVDSQEASWESRQRKMPQFPSQPMVESKSLELDYIELFADITKWLEYDVLINNYRGILTMPNGQAIGSGWESSIFGLLAALSSQLYTDVLYIYSDFGNPLRRQKTLNRSLEGWTSIYATKCLSAATLFGVYEAVRAPSSRLFSELISGGVTGCVGSNDFNLCMETYLIDNPPKASLQAVFRAFVVSSMNWVDNFTWFLPLNDQESFESFARGTIVSLYSILVRFFNA